jgi:hypothetical protein
MQLQSGDWIAIISAVAAWLAAWQAFRSSRIARYSYKLALKQEQRLEPSLEVYLVDAYIRRLTPPSRRLFVFQITISNTSFAGNGLKELHLAINCSRRQGPSSVIVVPHKIELGAHLNQSASDILEIPSSIAAHTVIGGLALFEVHDEPLGGLRVESYTLKLLDTYGNETEKEAILLQERRDESLE